MIKRVKPADECSVVKCRNKKETTYGACKECDIKIESFLASGRSPLKRGN